MVNFVVDGIVFPPVYQSKAKLAPSARRLITVERLDPGKL